jgi:hypothetical protein
MIITQDHGVRRLKELRGWADYIVESLTRDQCYEPGKVKQLEELVDSKDLEDLRVQASSLRDRLEALIARVDD